LIKVTAGQLFASKTAIDELVAKDIPGTAALTLRRVLKRTDGDFRSFEDQRASFAAKFGTPGKEPGTFGFTTEQATAFNEEIAKLSIVEFEYPELEMIPGVDFTKVDVKTSTLLVLDWLISD